jgi:hypothetical protein
MHQVPRRRLSEEEKSCVYLLVSENIRTMNTIEIKQRKKLVAPFISVCILIMLITAGGIFLTDKYKDDTMKKVSFVVGLTVFAYLIYSPVKKLVKNQPIIILTDDSIVLYDAKQVVIRKEKIIEIDVAFVDETGYFLNIKTENETHKTNISWLDRTPNEIKDLIKKYAPMHR